MIKNSGKKIKFGLLSILLFSLGAALYALSQNRAPFEDFFALSIFYVLLMLSSYFGLTAGLVFSLVGVLLYGGRYFYDAMVREIPLNIHAREFTWIIFFPLASLVGGYAGDMINFVEKLFRKFRPQIESLLLTGQLGMMGNEITFQQGLREECSRARRSLSQFTFLLLELENQYALEKKLGKQFLDSTSQKISEVICRSTRDIDRKGKLDDTRFGVVLADCPRDRCEIVLNRITSSLHQVEFDQQGRTVKTPIELRTAVVSYPESGNSAELLMANAFQELEKKRTLPSETNVATQG